MTEAHRTEDQHIFHVGEIAEWQNLGDEDEVCNGQECIVIGPMEWAETTDRCTGEQNKGFGYEVEDSEGVWFAFFWEIRKKPSKQKSRQTVLEECA